MTTPITLAGFESPSLSTSSAGPGPAFELKFLITEERARDVEEWAQRRLMLDPHGDPALGGAYQITSVYSDTTELDVYCRSPNYRRSKFRVRRYGSAAWAFLERKSKRGDRVNKRRTAISDAELLLLNDPTPVETWPGRWFNQRLQARRLAPACRIGYLRTAFASLSGDGPTRLTLDRNVRGVLTSEWRLDPIEDGRPMLTGQVILELKFRVAMPAQFKDLVSEFLLSPTPVSKYRLCREAWGATFHSSREGIGA